LACVDRRGLIPAESAHKTAYSHMGRITLTIPRVDAFTCPEGKSQAFLWDADVPRLGLRATPGGTKTYIFQSRFRRPQCTPSQRNAVFKAAALQRRIISAVVNPQSNWLTGGFA
jgi:hypothetical protein